MFYFGAAGGGVWKTDNAGATWQPMSDGLDSAPVGAIAIAPSDPKTLYVGMGHPEPRYDIAAGDGLVRFLKGGRTVAVASIGRDEESLRAELALEGSG